MVTSAKRLGEVFFFKRKIHQEEPFDLCYMGESLDEGNNYDGNQSKYIMKTVDGSCLLRATDKA